jgi:hypothetical protein
VYCFPAHGEIYPCADISVSLKIFFNFKYDKK